MRLPEFVDREIFADRLHDVDVPALNILRDPDPPRPFYGRAHLGQEEVAEAAEVEAEGPVGRDIITTLSKSTSII